MDPRDHLRALLDGMAFTVCDVPVPGDRTHRLVPHCGATFMARVARS